MKDNEKFSGLRLYFLGSSVTYGSAAGGVSFVEHLAERLGCECVKNAVSGTTLADIDDSSYVSRLEQDLAAGGKYDYFICQLSTNDSWRGVPLGEPVGEGSSFDTATVCGAIEHIISRVRSVWGCPVAFYTGTRYDSPEYAAMVSALEEIARLWGIGVIDLWNDADMLAVSPEYYAVYMNDPVHPTSEGYVSWWTPKFEQYLRNVIVEK